MGCLWTQIFLFLMANITHSYFKNDVTVIYTDEATYFGQSLTMVRDKLMISSPGKSNSVLYEHDMKTKTTQNKWSSKGESYIGWYITSPPEKNALMIVSYYQIGHKVRYGKDTSAISQHIINKMGNNEYLNYFGQFVKPNIYCSVVGYQAATFINTHFLCNDLSRTETIKYQNLAEYSAKYNISQYFTSGMFTINNRLETIFTIPEKNDNLGEMIIMDYENDNNLLLKLTKYDIPIGIGDSVVSVRRSLLYFTKTETDYIVVQGNSYGSGYSGGFTVGYIETTNSKHNFKIVDTFKGTYKADTGKYIHNLGDLDGNLREDIVVISDNSYKEYIIVCFQTAAGFLKEHTIYIDKGKLTPWKKVKYMSAHTMAAYSEDKYGAKDIFVGGNYFAFMISPSAGMVTVETFLTPPTMEIVYPNMRSFENNIPGVRFQMKVFNFVSQGSKAVHYKNTITIVEKMKSSPIPGMKFMPASTPKGTGTFELIGIIEPKNHKVQNLPVFIPYQADENQVTVKISTEYIGVSLQPNSANSHQVTYKLKINKNEIDNLSKLFIFPAKKSNSPSDGISVSLILNLVATYEYMMKNEITISFPTSVSVNKAFVSNAHTSETHPGKYIIHVSSIAPNEKSSLLIDLSMKTTTKAETLSMIVMWKCKTYLTQLDKTYSHKFDIMMKKPIVPTIPTKQTTKETLSTTITTTPRPTLAYFVSGQMSDPNDSSKPRHILSYYVDEDNEFQFHISFEIHKKEVRQDRKLRLVLTSPVELDSYGKIYYPFLTEYNYTKDTPCDTAFAEGPVGEPYTKETMECGLWECLDVECNIEDMEHEEEEYTISFNATMLLDGKNLTELDVLEITFMLYLDDFNDDFMITNTPFQLRHVFKLEPKKRTKSVTNYIIIGVVVGIVLLIALIVTIVIVYKWKKEKVSYDVKE